MTFRLVEKFPTLWHGELVVNCTKALIKTTYVSGDMRIALDALPMNYPTSAVVLSPHQNAPFPWDESKNKKCILTATPQLPTTNGDPNVCPHLLFDDMINFLYSKKFAGAVADMDNATEEAEKSPFSISIYLKSAITASVLSRLAPDWFYTVCDKSYLLMVITELESAEEDESALLYQFDAEEEASTP